jgi:hypothetical protein
MSEIQTNEQLTAELYFYLEKLGLVQARVDQLVGHEVLQARIQSTLASVQAVLTDAIIVLQ